MQLFLLLFFLLDQVIMVTAVPGCQDGRDRDHRRSTNCKEAGLSDVPAGLDPQIRVLLFPNNLISSLSWSSFTVFTDLYEIDLTGNKVPEVTPSGSPLLPTLSVLRLGSNRLTSLSDHAFSACPALTELYLDNNTIVSLTDQTFSGLDRLQILDLSSNQIKVLPQLMLHPLTSIEILYMENNKIKLMPDGWFNKKEEVPYLFLSANPWDCTCSNLYLQTYMVDFDLNVYIRDGETIMSGALEVVCSSPPWHVGKPVMNLEESDLCSPHLSTVRPNTESPTTQPRPAGTSESLPSILTSTPTDEIQEEEEHT
ncbi:SLIT and NTRK-like protein 2 isoform X2 [Cheilinus undulatus]|uniref:SLIT and NTRK-like protein 2 isoform X2 n=1 Tax=Cheilinus undulatus TaxID=241271 RepID=UPI001BD44D9F|nr:SLIT and NTRK-like protein 2 isoform X2 [Cheilinus undulatus]